MSNDHSSNSTPSESGRLLNSSRGVAFAPPHAIKFIAFSDLKDFSASLIPTLEIPFRASCSGERTIGSARRWAHCSRSLRPACSRHRKRTSAPLRRVWRWQNCQGTVFLCAENNCVAVFSGADEQDVFSLLPLSRLQYSLPQLQR